MGSFDRWVAKMRLITIHSSTGKKGADDAIVAKLCVYPYLSRIWRQRTQLTVPGQPRSGDRDGTVAAAVVSVLPSPPLSWPSSANTAGQSPRGAGGGGASLRRTLVLAGELAWRRRDHGVGTSSTGGGGDGLACPRATRW